MAVDHNVLGLIALLLLQDRRDDRITGFGTDDAGNTGSYTGITFEISVGISGFVMHIEFQVSRGTIVDIMSILEYHGIGLAGS